MHFTLLTAVSVPQFHKDKNKDDQIAAILQELETQLSSISEAEKDKAWQIKWKRDRLRQFATTFARDVDDAVWGKMAPFAAETDPQYLEFNDETGDLIDEYENDGTDCILYPDGKIESLYANKNFRVENGKLILSQNSKNTEKDLQQLKLLQNYPNKKLYKSYKEMAEDHGYMYDEDNKAYGYYTNPNTIWDWYVIGGRWPNWFLVKNTCCEYIIAPTEEPAPCPEGYMWVCAARKQEIQWEIMRKWRTECRTKEFYMLKEILISQTVPKDSYLRITDKGIEEWGELIFWEGETLEEYLLLHNADPESIYPSSFSYLADGEYSEGERDSDEWRQELAGFIESVSPCDVLVGIDYHI